MSSSVSGSPESTTLAKTEQPGAAPPAPSPQPACFPAQANEPLRNEDLVTAQAEWRARKRREFEEKRRKRQEREQAILTPKAPVISTSDEHQHEYVNASKKPKLEEDGHDDFDPLHHHHLHHHLHHHHQHHHLHHPDHIDHLHHHHHHHIGHDLALHPAEHDHTDEPSDMMRELDDQKLAQARWREQKRRELAERKAKRSSGRTKKSSAAHDHVHSTIDGEQPTEDLVPSSSNVVTGSAGNSGAEVTRTNPLSCTTKVEAHAKALEADSLEEPTGPGAGSAVDGASTLEEAAQVETYGIGLAAVDTGDVVNISLPVQQSTSASSLDVALSTQGDLRPIQTQHLSPEEVLGDADVDQELHNNILSSWQSLDSLAPPH